MGERRCKSRMTAHQAKKLDVDALKFAFRDRFELPLSDDDMSRNLDFLHARPQDRRSSLSASKAGARHWAAPCRPDGAPTAPTARQSRRSKAMPAFALATDGKEMSTTDRRFVRLLDESAASDKELGPRIVPIVADEARTFGMANLFRPARHLFAASASNMQPEDRRLDRWSYREATVRTAPGRRHHRGWCAVVVGGGGNCRTAYAQFTDAAVLHLLLDVRLSARRRPHLGGGRPAHARLFVRRHRRPHDAFGGEGLQHQDGTSHLVAATVPNCKAYDPGTAAELAVIVERGMREMLEEQSDVFYYVTAMNENIAQASLPAEAHEGVLRGLYRCRAATNESPRRVQLLASGAMLGEALKAADALAAEHGVAADVWSVTSFSELARAGVAAETAWRHGKTSSVRCWLSEQLAPTRGPIVIASDYVRAVPEQIRAFLPSGRKCVTLGTDGFGRSDTRAALRRHFEVDAAAIVEAGMRSLQ